MRARRIGGVAAASLCVLLATSTASPAADTPQNSSQAMALKQGMRKLWTDHVVWTREYIIAAVGDQPDAQAAAARLMKNQDDIGQAVAMVYGAPAGQQLTSLLKDHITIAVELIKSAKAGDKTAQQQADGKWHENASKLPTSSARPIPTGHARRSSR